MRPTSSHFARAVTSSAGSSTPHLPQYVLEGILIVVINVKKERRNIHAYPRTWRVRETTTLTPSHIRRPFRTARPQGGHGRLCQQAQARLQKHVIASSPLDKIKPSMGVIIARHEPTWREGSLDEEISLNP